MTPHGGSMITPKKKKTSEFDIEDAEIDKVLDSIHISVASSSNPNNTYGKAFTDLIQK